jgi:hypothetical protein
VKITKSSVVALAALFVGGCAYASPIGTLGIGSAGVVDATLTSILFTTDNSAQGTCPGAACNGEVNSGTTLTFSGGPLTVGEGILINGGLPFGAPPPVGATLFNPFLQFANHSNLTYTLTGVDAGSSNTNCVGLTNGQSCSINVAGSTSPVLLTVNGTNTNVAISLFGIASDGSGVSNWTGGFSATIPDTTPLAILQFFCGTDNVCDSSDVAAGKVLEVRSTSGSFFANAAAVPEPGTVSLFAIGAALIGLSWVRRPSRKRV